MIKESNKLISKYFVELKTSNDGLTPFEAQKRLLKNGLNSVGVNTHITLLRNVLSQFTDLLVIILLFLIIGTESVN